MADVGFVEGPFVRSMRRGLGPHENPVWHRDSGRPRTETTDTRWDEAWSVCGIHFVRLLRRNFERRMRPAASDAFCKKCVPFGPNGG